MGNVVPHEAWGGQNKWKKWNLLPTHKGTLNFFYLNIETPILFYQSCINGFRKDTGLFMQREKFYHFWIKSLQKLLELKQTYTIYFSIILNIMVNFNGSTYLSWFYIYAIIHPGLSLSGIHHTGSWFFISTPVFDSPVLGFIITDITHCGLIYFALCEWQRQWCCKAHVELLKIECVSLCDIFLLQFSHVLFSSKSNISTLNFLYSWNFLLH